MPAACGVPGRGLAWGGGEAAALGPEVAVMAPPDRSVSPDPLGRTHLALSAVGVGKRGVQGVGVQPASPALTQPQHLGMHVTAQGGHLLIRLQDIQVRMAISHRHPETEVKCAQPVQREALVHVLQRRGFPRCDGQAVRIWTPRRLALLVLQVVEAQTRFARHGARVCWRFNAGAQALAGWEVGVDCAKRR